MMMFCYRVAQVVLGNLFIGAKLSFEILMFFS